ncbi:LysR family transcriptional regulator [Opitutaceae bacterium EW11]|nr:LysR family transcriptional regulator [Opitutaceae bacterium EW11]
MDYSLRELECFAAVAEELSFTRAALRLHLAQPPLSRHIRALEEKLGVRLFERTRRRVALTAAGRRFYEESQGVLPQLVRAGEAAKRSQMGETSRLRLGFVSAVLSPELVETLRRFRQQHPAVQLMLHDASPAEQLSLLGAGTLDGGFVGLKPLDPAPGIHFHPWRSEPLACFVPAGHPLAARPRIDVADLADEPFVAVSGEAAPAFAAYVRGLCREAGYRPRIVLESPRAQAVAVMVAAGSGVALLPESLARVMGNAVVALPLRRTPKIVHVFARRAGKPSPAMHQFLERLE